MKEKDKPTESLDDDGESDELGLFVRVFSSHIVDAMTAIRHRDFDVGLVSIEHAISACEAAPECALLSRRLETLEALAIAAAKRAPADYEEKAAAIQRRVLEFRWLRVH